MTPWINTVYSSSICESTILKAHFVLLNIYSIILLFKSLHINNAGGEFFSLAASDLPGGNMFAETSRAGQLVNWKVMYLAWIIEYRVYGISTEAQMNPSQTYEWKPEASLFVYLFLFPSQTAL